MEDAWRTYSHDDDEIINLYANLGNDGIEFKDERVNLVETIKGLKKYVQSNKAENERLMRAKEKQYDFNVKLMQSLDR
jgi:hypothetical protein